MGGHRGTVSIGCWDRDRVHASWRAWCACGWVHPDQFTSRAAAQLGCNERKHARMLHEGVVLPHALA